ncbi:ATPase family gene 2 protein [Fusarium oxysporum f. sp. cubense]|uniref:ATPase family gene 2 protein n=1 Tax=Fusarium oxysporum f. sp. cubense TaxID=61366 RepID=A0A559KYK8_FUSOC|nr:ATPase family gene 2 protein [Fusarium oxysporum f. sp. cubense]
MTSDQLHPKLENGTEPTSQESICESKVYHHTKNKDGRDQCKEQLQDSEPTKDSEDDEDSPYALIVRRRFSEKREVESTTVCINSPLIHKAFQDVIGSYPTVASDFKSSFKLESPFQILLHYWDPLEAYRDEAASPRMRQHLSLLFRFMEEEMGPERRTLQHMLQKHMITFKQAWVIYRPGDLVVSDVLGKSWLSRVEKMSYGTSRNRGPYVTIHMKYCDANDDAIGEAQRSTNIFQSDYFASDHPAKIKRLPVYPRKFCDRGPDLEIELLERGKKFITNRGILTKDYDGIAEWLKEPPLDFFDPNMADYPPIWLPFTETGRVVLDRKTFEEDNYSHVTMIEEVEDPEIFLCPPYALGYSTGRKEWCRYLVDNLRDVSWKEDAWSSLILDQEQKKVLKALVMSHKHPERVRSQSEQKGKGLVVLLHGTPGSGKTLSAETAAEMSKKALLSTSMSELNRYDRAYAFEHRLKQILQYATTWNAIILFDEADVFLESRDLTSNSTTRNALVAVFLKHLEYFSGIVFLTTNRLSSIDAAMKSRIHLSLSFGPPAAEVRRQIWRQSLKAVPIDETEIGGDELSSQAADDLIHHKLNGREISNALNTARTLARFEEAKLCLHHIETVLKIGQTFGKNIGPS